MRRCWRNAISASSPETGVASCLPAPPAMVDPGGVAVPLGPDARTAAGALAQAIAGRLRAALTAQRHPQDTTTIDLCHRTFGGQLVLEQRTTELQAKFEALQAMHAHFVETVARLEALELHKNPSIQSTAVKSLGGKMVGVMP